MFGPISASCLIAGKKSGMVFRDSALVQDSAGVPPHEVWIIPMGTFISLWRWRAKKYPAAEKCPAVSGEHVSHEPAQSFWGLRANAFITVNIRRFG